MSTPTTKSEIYVNSLHADGRTVQHIEADARKEGKAFYSFGSQAHFFVYSTETGEPVCNMQDADQETRQFGAQMFAAVRAHFGE